MHLCPFAHDELPLPEPVRIFLEDNLIGLFSRSPAPDNPPSIDSVLPEADRAESSEIDYYKPVLRAFSPWVGLLQAELRGNTQAGMRVAHDAVSYIAEILNTSGLSDQIHQIHHQLEDQHLEQIHPGLSISQRALAGLAHSQRREQALAGLGRGLIRILFRSLPRYLDNLIAAARVYRESGEIMRNAFGQSSGLWDLEPGVWQKFPQQGLEESAALLASQPSIQELTDTLGRRAVESLPPQKPPVDQRPVPETALGKSELVGLTQGNSLEDLLPRELAYLANPATGSIFARDYVEGRLMVYQYKTRRPPEKNRLSEPAAENREQQLGPFILCVDTSGSMAGAPEQVAKALSLAVIRRGLSTGRRICLVSFSDRAVVTEIHPSVPEPGSGDEDEDGDGDGEPGNYQRADLGKPEGIEGYLEFLQHSFRGGTDLRPALEEAISAVRDRGWQGADLLIVSDFRVPKIMIKKSPKLRAIQEDFGTRVHALSIGQFPIDDTYNLFDSRWLFRITRHGEYHGIEETQ